MPLLRSYTQRWITHERAVASSKIMNATLPICRKSKALIRYLDSLDWRVGNTKHLQQYSAFLRAASLGIDPEVALKIIAERVEENGGQLIPHEIVRQQQRAYEYV